MKRTVENTDGMYPYAIAPIEEWTDEECQRSDADRHDRMDMGTALATLGRDAKVMSNHANQFVRSDAEMVTCGISEIQRLLNSGEAERAVSVAIIVGRLHERMFVRQFEPWVVHSTQSKRGASKARQTKDRNKLTRQQKITQAVNDRLDANKKESLHSARKYVAMQLGLSFDTVKRATTTMKTRKKTKK